MRWTRWSPPSVAAEGARIRVTGPLYFNPQVAYYSGFSSASFQAGFGLILF